MYAAYTYAALRQGELLVIVPGLPESIDLGQPAVVLAGAALALLISNAVLGGAPLRARVPAAARRAAAGEGGASLGVLVVLQELLAIRVGTGAVRVAADLSRGPLGVGIDRRAVRPGSPRRLGSWS